MKTLHYFGLIFVLFPVTLSAQFSKVQLDALQKAQNAYTNEDVAHATSTISFRPLLVSFSIDVYKFFDPRQKLDDIDGSPFLIPKKWVHGTISFTHTDDLYTTEEMNYCILLQQIWVRDNEELLALTDQKMVKKIVLNNSSTFVYKDQKGKPNLYELIVETPGIELIKRYEARMFGPEQVSSGYKTPKNARVETTTQLFFWKIGQEPVMIVNNRDNLVQLFPDHQPELKTFADKNKINPKNEKDLIRLFEYYRSLQ